MSETPGVAMLTEQDRRIAEVVAAVRLQLRNFIRRRVPDPADTEDIVQEVFRRKKAETFSDMAVEGQDGERLRLEELLPSPEAGPEAVYARQVLIEELEDALEELPDEQREVFVAHELEGRSFREMAEESGVNINTLLSRKRYAVLHLRERLQGIYDEYTKR